MCPAYNFNVGHFFMLNFDRVRKIKIFFIRIKEAL